MIFMSTAALDDAVKKEISQALLEKQLVDVGIPVVEFYRLYHELKRVNELQDVQLDYIRSETLRDIMQCRGCVHLKARYDAEYGSSWDMSALLSEKTNLIFEAPLVVSGSEHLGNIIYRFSNERIATLELIPSSPEQMKLFNQ